MLCVVTLLVVCSLAPAWSVIVDTKYGQVQGETLTLEDIYFSGTEIDTFLSIPFAKPPLGEKRFLDPEEPDPWDEVFNATSLGTACEQLGAVLLLTHFRWDDIGEDCLHLSIYAPHDKSGGPYPVMVWIHGGGYQEGANIQYPSHFLAAMDVIVVVPNYRLGIIGFAYSEDDAAPGNQGLKDQTLALRFVQENIADFGGDPDKVTLFGQSAGANSAGNLMMSPETTGLFHQAGLLSGNEMKHSALWGSTHDHLDHLEQVAVQANCTTEDTSTMVDCLRQVPSDVLYPLRFDCNPGVHCGGFRPVVDGGFIPDWPENIRQRGEHQIVPEVIGITRNDDFISLMGQDPLSRVEFEDMLREWASYRAQAFEDESREEDFFEALNFCYSPWPHLDDGEANRHALGEFSTDLAFGAPADYQAKLHAPDATVYYYIFDYMLDNLTLIPDWMGTVHAIDTVFLFAYSLQNQNPAVREQSGMHEIIEATPEEDEFAIFFMELWTNFAKYGSPTPSPVQAPDYMNQTAVTWTDFRPHLDDYGYLYMGKHQVAMDESYRQHYYAFWQQYQNWLLFGDEGRPINVL